MRPEEDAASEAGAIAGELKRLGISFDSYVNLTARLLVEVQWDFRMAAQKALGVIEICNEAVLAHAKLRHKLEDQAKAEAGIPATVMLPQLLKLVTGQKRKDRAEKYLTDFLTDSLSPHSTPGTLKNWMLEAQVNGFSPRAAVALRREFSIWKKFRRKNRKKSLDALRKFQAAKSGKVIAKKGKGKGKGKGKTRGNSAKSAV